MIAKGRVYLIDLELMKPAARERIRCFDEVRGTVLWTHAYTVTYPDWTFVPGQGGGPTATPIVEDERVFSVDARA